MLVRVLQLISVATALLYAVEAATQPTVTLSTGAKVSGLVETSVAGGQVNAYLGIPYTDAPVGDKRWKQARLKALTEDLNATKYGDVCFGNPAFDAASGQFPNSEDCLYLNVFTPAEVTSSSKLPVMVWIHGGGFSAGASNVYDSANLVGASGQSVVAVTLNYRLGIFGLMYSKEIAAEGDGGNFALRDQEVALQWVKQNIASFGGDPNDITAFGESAGASSLGVHLVARNGKQQLFNRAILQSGAYPLAQMLPTRESEARQTAAVAAQLGCSSTQGSVLNCMRQIDPRAVFDAAGGFGWSPTVDGVFLLDLPTRSVAAGKVSEVPTIIGTNTDEGWLFSYGATQPAEFDGFVRSSFPLLTDDELAQINLLYSPSSFLSPQHRTAEVFADSFFKCASDRLSTTLARTVPASYRYRFNHTTNTFGLPLVVHAQDLDYVFNRVANLPKNDAPTKVVVDHFQRFWTSFARFGSPAGEEQWPAFDSVSQQQIVIQPTLALEKSGADAPGHTERCAFWNTVDDRIAAAIAQGL